MERLMAEMIPVLYMTKEPEIIINKIKKSEKRGGNWENSPASFLEQLRQC